MGTSIGTLLLGHLVSCVRVMQVMVRTLVFTYAMSDRQTHPHQAPIRIKAKGVIGRG
jgi:hypothetical protein